MKYFFLAALLLAASSHHHKVAHHKRVPDNSVECFKDDVNSFPWMLGDTGIVVYPCDLIGKET